MVQCSHSRGWVGRGRPASRGTLAGPRRRVPGLPAGEAAPQQARVERRLRAARRRQGPTWRRSQVAAVAGLLLGIGVHEARALHAAPGARLGEGRRLEPAGAALLVPRVVRARGCGRVGAGWARASRRGSGSADGVQGGGQPTAAGGPAPHPPPPRPGPAERGPPAAPRPHRRSCRRRSRRPCWPRPPPPQRTRATQRWRARRRQCWAAAGHRRAQTSLLGRGRRRRRRGVVGWRRALLAACGKCRAGQRPERAFPIPHIKRLPLPHNSQRPTAHLRTSACCGAARRSRSSRGWPRGGQPCRRPPPPPRPPCSARRPGT